MSLATEQVSTGSLSRKNTNFSLRSLFRSSHRHRSKESVNSSKSSGSTSSTANQCEQKPNELLMCNICLSWKCSTLFPVLLSCEHRNCVDCLRQHLAIAVKESRVMVSCPECSEGFHPSDVKSIVNDDNIYAKYEEFTLRRALVGIADIRWCPAPDCGYGVIASGCAGCPQLKCQRPGCNFEFCYHCRQVWHPNTTCDHARMQNQFEIRSLTSSDRKTSSMNHEDIKPCPNCTALIMKMDDGTCNHMTCAVCGGEFCWLCMKEISDLHYLSPSGCTFWGKKPWSRKKKIMWQMGTLIGAPVGIGLAAGVVLPAMMIGIPIYAGRRIWERFYGENVHRRNLAITGGVALSVVVSPLLAALTVGVGVPIALGYVYGVVPISLCRSGGCTGVTTSRNGHGVNLDFNEHDNDGPYMLNTSDKNSPARRASVATTTDHPNGGVFTIKASINKDHQPSMTGSADSTSLDERSYIAHFPSHRDHDIDSHASLIPAPRSTTTSITSSLDNVKIKLPEVETMNRCRDDSVSIRSTYSTNHTRDTVSLSSVPENSSNIITVEYVVNN